MRPACDQDSRIWAGGQGAEAGFGSDQAGSHVLDDLGDLRLEPGSLSGEGGDALAEPDQGLMQDPGLAVRDSGIFS
jgi:hypothetical protein